MLVPTDRDKYRWSRVQASNARLIRGCFIISLRETGSHENRQRLPRMIKGTSRPEFLFYARLFPRDISAEKFIFHSASGSHRSQVEISPRSFLSPTFYHIFIVHRRMRTSYRVPDKRDSPFDRFCLSPFSIS